MIDAKMYQREGVLVVFDGDIADADVLQALKEISRQIENDFSEYREWLDAEVFGPNAPPANGTREIHER